MFIIEAIFSFLRDALGVILAILLGTLCLSMVVNLIVIVVKTPIQNLKELLTNRYLVIDSFLDSFSMVFNLSGLFLPL